MGGVGRWSGSMLKSVGGWGYLSSGFLWGAIERESLVSGSREKERNWLGSLRHHSSRGPGAGLNLLGLCLSTLNSRNVGEGSHF